VSDGSKLSFVRVMLLASRGRHTRLAQVGATRAASVTVTADRVMSAGADGEPLPGASPLATGVPLCIKALRGVLRCVVGPAGLPARRGKAEWGGGRGPGGFRGVAPPG